jgi:hypothetical protein
MAFRSIEVPRLIGTHNLLPFGIGFSVLRAKFVQSVESKGSSQLSPSVGVVSRYPGTRNDVL